MAPPTQSAQTEGLLPPATSESSANPTQLPLTKDNLSRLGQAPKDEGWLRWCMDRQLEIMLSVLWSKFIFLSFQQAETGLYFKGRDDAYFIAFWVVMFWFAREAAMRWVFNPLGRRVGISKKRSLVRWSEQSWAMLFPTVFWSLGMYIMQTSPYKNLTTEQYYLGYPHDALPALTKWYYLVQTAFWIQQIVVLNLEARRKDHYQMFAHHIITTLLMSFSYVLNYTRIGNAILCTMDFTDIILPAAKLCLYAEKVQAADAMLAFYVVSWIATRHVLFGMLLWSVAFELPTILPYGWRPSEGYFNSWYSHKGFVALLTALQILICIWLWMILKVAYSAVTGNGPADSRSDSGGSDDSEDEIVLIDDAEDAEPSERKKDK